MRAVGLRCEHREDTPCIDDPAPRLSWQLESDGVDQRQTGYHLVVEQTATRCGTAGWSRLGVRRRRLRRSPASRRSAVHVARPVRDRTTACPTGAIPRASASVSPRGPRLDHARSPRRPGGARPGRPRGWTRRRDARPASALPVLPPATFELARATWRARRCTPRRAGVLELELNGARVGDAVLSPGWTDYRARIEYADARRDRAAAQGRRTCSARCWATAGTPGWSASTRVAAAITTAASSSCCASCTSSTPTASREVVASDAAGRRPTGPLVYSDLLMGERCDARREPGPWRPGADPGARHIAARATARAADAGHRGAPRRSRCTAAARARTSSTSARTWSAGRGWRQRRARHARADALRRDARARRLAARGQPAQRAPARHLRARGRRPTRSSSRASPSTAFATSR